MGDACARGLIRRRLLSDVCSYPASRNASVSVARRWLLVACRGPRFTFFPSNVCGVAILRNLNTETRVFRTKLAIVTFILKPTLLGKLSSSISSTQLVSDSVLNLVLRHEVPT